MTTGTIAELLDECATARPDRPLLIDVTGTARSVSEVAALSSAATRWLWDVGVRPSMTVAWQLPSTVSAAIVMLALSRTPVAQAPVLHLYGKRQVSTAMNLARADVLIVDESTAANVPARSRVILVPNDLVECLEISMRSPHPELTSPIRSGEPSWVYFTSNAAGKPKTLRHSDASLLSAARGYLSQIGLGSEPREVGTIAAPIAHVGGMVHLTAALLGDFPIVLEPELIAEGQSGLIVDHGGASSSGSQGRGSSLPKPRTR